MLSGYGSFGTYTLRIGKTTNDLCQHCRGAVDSLEHTWSECPHWWIWREELRGTLSKYINTDIELSPGFLLPYMIESHEVWIIVSRYCTRIISEKIVKEREEEDWYRRPRRDRLAAREEEREDQIADRITDNIV